MKIKSLLLICIIMTNTCFAGLSIIPTKNIDQEEILQQGASILISKKQHSVLMYQTCGSIEKRAANFFFAIRNNSDKLINIYFDNLSVTDQFGRQVNVISKHKLISREATKKGWRKFGSALSTSMAYANANNAGKINYQSRTNTSYNEHSNTIYKGNYNTFGNNNYINGSFSGRSQSTTLGSVQTSTTGTVQVEALRQQAIREATLDAQCRDALIQANYDFNVESLQNFYFDSTTIFPEQVYGANFQIQIDKSIEKELQYLLFTFSFEGEEHTFCFRCK